VRPHSGASVERAYSGMRNDGFRAIPDQSGQSRILRQPTLAQIDSATVTKKFMACSAGIPTASPGCFGAPNSVLLGGARHPGGMLRTTSNSVHNRSMFRSLQRRLGLLLPTPKDALSLAARGRADCRLR